MLKILVAPASYKGTIAAHSLAAAIAQGCEDFLNEDIQRLYGSFEIKKMPIADGGDDTLTAIQEVLGGELVESDVIGPTGQTVRAGYLKIEQDGQPTAIVELARASGIAYLKEGELAPLTAHTYGTGQLISRAIAGGAKKVIIMIGGSASTDGGTGALAAMGAKFLDKDGQSVPLGGGSLSTIERVDLSELLRLTNGVKFIVASDVTNRLTGESGAAAIFGPQKGATPEDVEILDRGLAKLAMVVERQLPKRLPVVSRPVTVESLGRYARTLYNSRMLKSRGENISTEVQELLRQIASRSGVIGSLMVSTEATIVASQMPPSIDLDTMGLWALAAYKNSGYVAEKMGHLKVYEVLARTPQGFIVLTEVNGGLLLILTEEQIWSPSSLEALPGGGAAGGAGFGFVSMLGAEIVSGFHYISGLLKLMEQIDWCDFVFIAEGRIDSQSLSGKGVGELIDLAVVRDKGIIALPASTELFPEDLTLMTGSKKLVLMRVAKPGGQATIDDVREAACAALKQYLQRFGSN